VAPVPRREQLLLAAAAAAAVAPFQHVVMWLLLWVLLLLLLLLQVLQQQHLRRQRRRRRQPGAEEQAELCAFSRSDQVSTCVRERVLQSVGVSSGCGAQFEMQVVTSAAEQFSLLFRSFS
jgi:hypothetical protein